MKYAKLTDLIGQGLLLLTTLLLLLFDSEKENALILFYYVLGGWQFLSFLIHLFVNPDSWFHQKNRMLYGKTILWTIVGLVGSFMLSFTGIPLLIYYLYAVVFITPLYALAYMMISYRECQSIARKELIHLKN